MPVTVGIILGSDSDLPVMCEAADVLHELRIEFELAIASAHRNPERASGYARTAAGRGLKVLIAGAGGAAHLPGVLAAYTTLPVIGVPVMSGLGGLDSLLSIAQMPSGIPVATMAVNGARNAGLFAAAILALADTELAERLEDYRKDLARKVEEKSCRLQELGLEAYLAEWK